MDKTKNISYQMPRKWTCMILCASDPYVCILLCDYKKLHKIKKYYGHGPAHGIAWSGHDTNSTIFMSRNLLI